MLSGGTQYISLLLLQLNHIANLKVLIDIQETHRYPCYVQIVVCLLRYFVTLYYILIVFNA